MDFAAPHIPFVFAAYGISALAIVALIAVTILRDRRTRRELEAAKDHNP